MREMVERKHTYVDKYIEYRICDLCGEKSMQYGMWKPDWDNDGRAGETNVGMKSGYYSAYDGTEWDERIEYDICPECFRKKLMPWLAEQGASPTMVDLDW